MILEVGHSVVQPFEERFLSSVLHRMDILDSSDEAAVSSVWISFHWLTEITRDPLVLWLQKGRENSRITNNHRNKTELLKWKTYIFFNVTIATPILDPCSLHLQWYVICAMCGFIAQLVEHRTGIAEVTGSNPVEALIFFQASYFQLLKLENLLRWSLFTSYTTAVQIWIVSYILHITSLHGKIWTQ